jgi:hypothetical protein
MLPELTSDWLIIHQLWMTRRGVSLVLYFTRAKQTARNPSQNAETDVDEQIGTATSSEQDWEEWEQEGDEVEDDGALFGLSDHVSNVEEVNLPC